MYTKKKVLDLTWIHSCSKISVYILYISDIRIITIMIIIRTLTVVIHVYIHCVHVYRYIIIALSQAIFGGKTNSLVLHVHDNLYGF